MIDLVDQLGPFQNMHRKRCTEYRKMGAVISKWNEDFSKIDYVKPIKTAFNFVDVDT